jgi:hypothetical protein
MRGPWQLVALVALVALAACGSITPGSRADVVTTDDAGETPSLNAGGGPRGVRGAAGTPNVSGASDGGLDAMVGVADAGGRALADAARDADEPADATGTARDAASADAHGDAPRDADAASPAKDGGVRADAVTVEVGGTSSCLSALALDRTCGKDDDCVIVSRRSSCCGAVRVLGLNAGARAAFELLETTCEATFGPCLCAAGPSTTDDGSTLGAGDTAAVVCAGKLCTTYVDACGKPCPSGMTCQTCTSNQSGKGMMGMGKAVAACGMVAPSCPGSD